MDPATVQSDIDRRRMARSARKKEGGDRRRTGPHGGVAGNLS